MFRGLVIITLSGRELHLSTSLFPCTTTGSGTVETQQEQVEEQRRVV